MKKDSLNNTIIFVGLVIAGLFVVAYFLYTNMVTKGQHIYELSQQSAQNVEYQQQMKNLVASLNVLAPKINAVDSYLVASDGEVSFIEQVENAAKADNVDVQIDSVVIQKTKELAPKGLEYLVLKITTTGGWTGTYRFSMALTNLPYRIFLDQEDLSLVNGEATTTAPVWRGSYDIKVLKKSETNQSTNQI